MYLNEELEIYKIINLRENNQKDIVHINRGVWGGSGYLTIIGREISN